MLPDIYGCLCVKSAKHKEIVFYPTLSEDNIHPKEWAGNSGYYSIPILARADKKVIGVMTCFVQGNIKNVAEDKDFLSNIAHSISSLIEHKMADEEVERHQDYLEKTVQERTKQLIHAERLATLGTFSAGMAHEINNPNSFIRGNIQYLQGFWKIAQPILRNHVNDDPSGRITRFIGEVQETLEDVLNGSQRISTIVDSLKKYSKGGFETDKVVCRLTDPVNDAMHLLERIIQKSKVAVESHIPADLVVNCDRQQISQVFVNLINNALHALEGTKIPTKLIKIHAERIDNHAWIRVIDNGPGIPEEAMGKIFDPFFTTKGKTKGTGLGLSIVQGIIEDHRGQITVYSAPGSDTEILIIFPLNPK